MVEKVLVGTEWNKAAKVGVFQAVHDGGPAGTLAPGGPRSRASHCTNIMHNYQ